MNNFESIVAFPDNCLVTFKPESFYKFSRTFNYTQLKPVNFFLIEGPLKKGIKVKLADVI